ncbi:MAG: hypothetical protein J1G06_04180 [Oscillospiraceae bacterium]|nr:hypothetical protein [Oscillospiraceae bacterium]
MKKKLISLISAAAISFAVLPALIVSAADTVYTFKGDNVITDGSTNDITDKPLTDSITVTTSGDMNRKYAAITTRENNRNAGTFPINDSFTASGSYIYLGTANVNNNAIITLNMPEIPAGSKVTLTYAKPVVTNNGSTLRNTNDPYAYLKIADRYISISGGEFDTWQTVSVITGEDTNAIEFHCDMWGAIAISKIEITDGGKQPLHSVTVNSTQYANITANGIKFFADANGQLTLTSLPEGETVTITAAKDSYADAEKTVTVADSDITVDMPLECEIDAAYYESDFGNNSGNLNLDGTFGIGKITAKDVTQISSRVTFTAGGTLKLTDNLTIKYDNGIYANNTYITPKDNMEFTVVMDKTSGKTILTQNDIPLYVDAAPVDTITGISGNNVTVEYLSVSYPDKNNLIINGSDTVSYTAEGKCTAKYSVTPAYLVPDMKPVYSVDGNSAITIDENGILTVPGDAETGSVKINAEYNGAAASKDIEIVPLEDNEALCNIKAYGFPNLHTTIDIKPIGIDDKFGNHIEPYDYDLFTEMMYWYLYGYSYSDLFDQYYIPGITTGSEQYILSETRDTSNIDSYIINYSDGTSEPIELTDIPAAAVTKDGTAVVSYYDNNGKLTASVKYDLKQGDKTVVSDSGKKVIFVSDGEFTELTEADTTLKGFEVNHTAGIKFEIDPVYKFSDIGDVKEDYVLDQVFTNGFYDITFKKAEAWRGDIYVNGAMVGNNVDQADADRKVTDGALYTAEDVKIGSFEIAVSMTDGSTMLDYITVTKKPNFYERPQRVYIIGDSLACIYYGDFEKEVGGGRAGWGQQLPDFLNVPVTDLANSGQYAAGLYTTAFPGVIQNAQEGDILLIECAYNDRSYSTRDEMIFCVKSMIRECREKGIIPILVTPNASAHDYKPSVVWSSYLRDVAVDMDCEIIDLSQKSYDILYSLYGDDADGNITKNFNLTEVGGDTLHSSYAGAYVWASVVAQGLKDLGYDGIVKSDFKYSFTDTLGNEITAEIR